MSKITQTLNKARNLDKKYKFIIIVVLAAIVAFVLFIGMFEFGDGGSFGGNGQNFGQREGVFFGSDDADDVDNEGGKSGFREGQGNHGFEDGEGGPSRGGASRNVGLSVLQIGIILAAIAIAVVLFAPRKIKKAKLDVLDDTWEDDHE